MRRLFIIALVTATLGVTVITNPTTAIGQSLAVLSTKVNILKCLNPVLRQIPYLQKTTRLA